MINTEKKRLGLKKITEKEKKELLVDLLGRLSTYFEKKQIKWFAAGGTMLGTVRHAGFIPWDDDIDLIVPREDFIKIIHLIEQDEKYFRENNMAIVPFDEHEKSYHKKFKIADIRTEMIEYGKPRPAVFIDVFPLDSFDEKNLGKQIKKTLLIDNLLVLCHSNYVSSSGVKKIAYTIMLGLFRILGRQKIELFLEQKLLKLTRNKENGFTGVTEGSYGFREFSRSDCYAQTIWMKFESVLMPCAQGYDTILMNMYGDYMTPPPPEEYHNHSYYNMYWKE